MTEDSKVRTAVPQDEEALMQLAIMLHEENGLFGLKEDRIRTIFKRAWAKDHVILGVIGPVGAPVAGVGLYVTECWYSGEPNVEELFNFVHPDHRRSLHARNLIEYAKSFSDAMGYPLSIGITSNHRTEQKLRLYRRRLGEPAGVYFVYNSHLIPKQVEVTAGAPLNG